MMYRIVFLPKKGQWVIQLSFMIIFWRTVCTNTAAKRTDMTFPNYIAAAKHVVAIGLEHVYKNYHKTVIHDILQGARPQDMELFLEQEEPPVLTEKLSAVAESFAESRAGERKEGRTNMCFDEIMGQTPMHA